MADHSTETPAVTTYGGVQDRPNDVNHPDNLDVTPTSTDPAQATNVPAGFTYDPDTDSYTRNGQ